MRLSVIIVKHYEKGNIKRTLKTVKGWVDEIIIVNSNEEKSGIKKASGDWILVLNDNEEISIPLKIEIRQTLPVTKYDGFYIPVLFNPKDVWIKKSSGELRLFKKLRIPSFNGYFKNPIRNYLDKKEIKLNFVSLRIKKILVIKLRGIGDTVILTPVFKNLKLYFKKAQVFALVNNSSVDVLKNNPHVKRVIPYRGFLKACLELRKEKFNMVICPQASFRTAFLSFLTGSKIRVVNNHNGKNYFSSISVFKPEEYETAIDRDLDCLRVLTIPVRTTKVEVFSDLSEKTKTFKLLQKSGINKEDILVGFGVGASKKHKIWFKERFAALADEIVKQFNYRIIFFFDPFKPELVTNVLNLMKNKAIVIKEPSLNGVIPVISRLNLFIGSDSGLSHIAVGLKTPTITIVGPEEARIFHPYLIKDKHYVISKDIECKPCWKEECKIPYCLDMVSVQDVLGVVKKWRKSAQL